MAKIQKKLNTTQVTANPTWLNISQQTAAVREMFYRQEETKAGNRAKRAFKFLQEQGILDKEGKLIKADLPDDMKPGSGCDVGG